MAEAGSGSEGGNVHRHAVGEHRVMIRSRCCGRYFWAAATGACGNPLLGARQRELARSGWAFANVLHHHGSTHRVGKNRNQIGLAVTVPYGTGWLMALQGVAD